MAGFTFWRVSSDILLPAALILTVLLLIPFPRKLRKGIVKMVDAVLSFPLLGSFKLFHVIVATTGLSFAETSRQTFALQQQRTSEMIETPNVVTGLLAKKWRSERNWWISLTCFTTWVLLAAFYRTAVHVLRLEDQLYGTGAPSTAAVAGAAAKKVAAPSAPPMETAGSPSVQMSGLTKKDK